MVNLKENKIKKNELASDSRLQQILAVERDIKPSSRVIIGLNEYKKFKSICDKLGLEFRHSDYKYLDFNGGFKWIPFNDKRSEKIVLYISKSRKIVTKLKDLEKNISMENNKRIGKILGYPSCCIEFYMEFIRSSIPPTPLQTFKNTKDPFSFYLNNIFLESSLKGPHLIFHIPCSYNCKKSIIFAKKILTMIKELTGNGHQKIRNFLKYPILYFDINNLVVFQGNYFKDKIKYQNVILPSKRKRTLNFLNKFNLGNEIKILPQKIQILKNNSVEHEVEKKNTLFFHFK